MSIRVGRRIEIKQRRGIVQMYTASAQQIGRTFTDKGEKDENEEGKSQ